MHCIILKYKLTFLQISLRYAKQYKEMLRRKINQTLGKNTLLKPLRELFCTKRINFIFNLFLILLSIFEKKNYFLIRHLKKPLEPSLKMKVK